MYSYKFLWLASLSLIGLASFSYTTKAIYQSTPLLTPSLTQATEPPSPPPGCDRTDPPDCQSRQPQPPTAG